MSDNFLLNMGKSSEGDVLDDAVATEVVDASFDLTTSEADSDVDVDEAEVESIFSKPGQWYVVHSQCSAQSFPRLFVGALRNGR